MLVYRKVFETMQRHELLQTTAVLIFGKWTVITGLCSGATGFAGLPMVFKISHKYHHRKNTLQKAEESYTIACSSMAILSTEKILYSLSRHLCSTHAPLECKIFWKYSCPL